MNPFNKSALVKNLFQIPFAAAVVLSIGLLSGCGGGDFVEMPDNPIPKPDNIEVFSTDGVKIVD